ncbi:MAG: hypothetical protein PHG53_09430 [Phycisphaerae bacterium]|nr:hypothetical protein [Phycisphaerae bacterium]
MPYYKLTDQNLGTYRGFQWTIGKWEQADGKGELCTEHWLHCYNSPLLAVFLNPVHGGIKNPRLFKIKVGGEKKSDRGLKFGFTKMRLVQEIPLPELTKNQKIAFGILVTKEIYKNRKWNKWANNWLNGRDRTIDAARAAIDMNCTAFCANDAAYAACSANLFDVERYAAWTAADTFKKRLPLIKLAKQALKYP